MKILQVENNVYYRGARSRVTDVEEAISTLGFDKIHMVILTTAVFEGGADAVAMAHVLHYGVFSVADIRGHCINSGIPVRLIPNDQSWSAV